MRAQLLPAFMAALLQEGVDPLLIERAVRRVRNVRLGEDFTANDDERRTFVFEQLDELERAL